MDALQETNKNLIPDGMIKGGFNSLYNLRTGLYEINKCRSKHGSKKNFNLETCNIEIKYVDLSTGITVVIQTCNAMNSSRISIQQYDKSMILVWIETHYFEPKMFRSYVNDLLTPEDLKQQGEFEQKKQELEDALEKAHDSIPQTCGGSDTCELCQDERSYYETSAHLRFGGYT